MSASPVPSPDELQAFLQGRLNEKQAQELVELIERSPEVCVALAELAQDNDSIENQLREAFPLGPLAREPALAEAMGKAIQLGTVVETVSHTSATELTVGLPTGGPDRATAMADDGSLVPGQQIGNYQLLEKLGQGGMGAVYKALHMRLGKTVAIKVLPDDRIRDPDVVARFLREMKAIGALEHHHIVRATDADEVAGQHFLVMEYVNGTNLSDLVRKFGPLPMAAACEMIRQAAQGLDYVHQRNLVHRDIKPSNLMLSCDGHVRILDLGLALLPPTVEAERELTTACQPMGTLDYMSPEQVDDAHDVDIRSDIYSLGATLYKLLTGQSVYAGPKYATTMQKMRALATEPVQPIRDIRPDLPAELSAVIDKMLAHDRTQRFAVPAEVAAALEPFAAGADLALLLENPLPSGDVSAPPASSSDFPGKSTAGQPVSGRYEGERPGKAMVEDTSDSPSRRPLVLVGIAVILIGVLAMAGVILSLTTPQCQIIVEVPDDLPADAIKDLRIEVNGLGGLKVADTKSGWTIHVNEGKYDVKLAGGIDHFTLEDKQVTVTREKATLLRVRLIPERMAGAAHPASASPTSAEKTSSTSGADMNTSASVPSSTKRPRWQPTPGQQAFLNAIPRLSAEEQIEYVSARLKELNRDFDGTLEPRLEDGQVVGLAVHHKRLTEIWPLAGLTRLCVLDLSDTAVADVSPLALLPLLEKLDCSKTLLFDVGPIANCMALKRFDCRATFVRDLSPLSGMDLEELRCRFFTAYDDRAVALVNSLPKLKSFNGLAPEQWLARKQEIETLRELAPALTAEALLARVLDKLEEYNPGFEREAVKNLSVENGKLVSLFWPEPPPGSKSLVDCTPLRAAVDVRVLFLGDTRIADLSPLRGLSLTALVVHGTEISDLTPLNGMPLTHLSCHTTQVSDLSPLAGMQLSELFFGPSHEADPLQVTDLLPLKGMPLTRLSCANSRIVDLTPLQGMPLTFLQCGMTPISDLAPLAGMPIEFLDVAGTQVSDISPLATMPLAVLDLSDTQVFTLAPLRGMPLTTLTFYRARKVVDITPLEGLPLTSLTLTHSQVVDLAPLKGMPLMTMYFTYAPISDLSPLRESPLTVLEIFGTRVSDLSPLRGIKLVDLSCDENVLHKHLDLLREMKSLKYINSNPASQYLDDQAKKATAPFESGK